MCIRDRTCAPGEEIYSYFGHTAIRYEEPSKGIDWVFNYGIFNFGAPNFIFRFALGQTDYILGGMNYDRFAAEYIFDERSVWQQTLNLTPEEKQKLLALLIENSRPENRVYRYNFFYDNCATRPRDKICLLYTSSKTQTLYINLSQAFGSSHHIRRINGLIGGNHHHLLYTISVSYTHLDVYKRQSSYFQCS